MRFIQNDHAYLLHNYLQFGQGVVTLSRLLLFLAVFSLLTSGVFLSNTAYAQKQPNGQPFDAIWKAINDMQKRIDSFFDIFTELRTADDALEIAINEEGVQRVLKDDDLQNQIDQIILSPGQQGPKGDPGVSPTVESEPPGENCQEGGLRIVDSFFDVFYVCNGLPGPQGFDGTNSLIDIISEPSGANCANGGIKVSAGMDVNRNSILDIVEISTSSFVCNGIILSNPPPANSPPIIESILINSGAPFARTFFDLTCVQTASDPDNDSLSISYKWLIDETDVGVNNNLLPSTLTQIGSHVVCEVTVNDGTDSTTSRSNVVEIVDFVSGANFVTVQFPTVSTVDFGESFDVLVRAFEAGITDQGQGGNRFVYVWLSSKTGEQVISPLNEPNLCLPGSIPAGQLGSEGQCESRLTVQSITPGNGIFDAVMFNPFNGLSTTSTFSSSNSLSVIVNP